jgi:hypothetical protein
MSNTPTPTPRTDAVENHAYQYDDDMTPVVRSDFARQLERELAEMDSKNILLRQSIQAASNEQTRLKKELTNAQRERDNALSDYRQADTDSIRALHERNEARAQRDALAVLAGELIAALRINYQYRGFSDATVEKIDSYLHPFETRLKSALAASVNQTS